MNSDRYQKTFSSPIQSYLAGNTPSFELGRHDSEFKHVLAEYTESIDFQGDSLDELNISDLDGLSNTLEFLMKRNQDEMDSKEFRKVLIKLIEAAQAIQNERIKQQILEFVSEIPVDD